MVSSRRYSAVPVNGKRLPLHEECLGQLQGSELILRDDAGTMLASVQLPIEEQNRIRVHGCGMAVVRVEEAGRPISGVADVSIQ